MDNTQSEMHLDFLSQKEILFPDDSVRWGASMIGVTVEEETDNGERQWQQKLPSKAQVSHMPHCAIVIPKSHPLSTIHFYFLL